MAHRTHRQLVALLACLTLASAAAPTAARAAEPRADDLERAEAKALEAKAFFKSQLYPQAAASYMQAYAISHKPATLFNAARSYEEAGLHAEAIALFEQYRQLPDVPADGRKDADERIARSRVAIQQRKTAPPATPTAPTPPPASATAAPGASAPASDPPEGPETGSATPEGAAPASTVTSPAPAATALPADPPSKALSWGLFAGGDVIVLLGILAYSGAVSSVTNANNMDFSQLGAEASYKSAISTARGTRNFSIGTMIVGAGLAGWGAWRLWGTSSSSTTSDAGTPSGSTGSRAWLTPLAGMGTTGVAVEGRF